MNFTNLFKTREQKTEIGMENFFSDIDISKFSENKAKLCEENLTKKRIIQFFEKYGK